MPNIRATQPYKEYATGRATSLVGSGPTQADAESELQALAALTVGIASGTPRVSIPSDATVTMHATGPYSDAVLVLHRTGDVSRKAVRKLQNITTDVASTAANGTIDLTNALITALATAYSDEDGNNDYVVESGWFVR